MNIDRRDFFKIFSAGVVTASSTTNVIAREPKNRLKDAVGILYDATLCIGCKACEVGCKILNNKTAEHKIEKELGVPKSWDSASDLSVDTLNKIKVYKNGNDFSFVKKACMHCVDPDCVSVCPTTALTKNQTNGIVSWDIDACCGCRYCQMACPFNIPKFEFGKAFPELKKCEMCQHLIADGGIPGCCESCPCGASIFGNVEDLLQEAHRRLNSGIGEEYNFPISELESQYRTTKPISKYVNYVYGEHENGGTQYIMLSAIPFEKLGMPILPGQSEAVLSEGIQHTLYKGLIAPFVLFAWLAFGAHRSLKNESTELDTESDEKKGGNNE
ncbi:MAG: hydrogenase 2 operon protein HybA [Calditrichaeota bacterium]|nr:MAG: hydrogenase 2 operon protein HybA [Calditrichota bacterium]MBL1206886.1 hydrogenase 2 operon protein HybA [Calditrichota bacterium]NOG46712.1 hydrogenase 2 operon protein HybA [Calditrichota bacterium]